MRFSGGRTLRSLVGPAGRRWLGLLVLTALWVGWLCGPVRPAIQWQCPVGQFDRFELAPDRQTIVHEPLSGGYKTYGDFHRRAPLRLCDGATGRLRFTLVGNNRTFTGIH